MSYQVIARKWRPKSFEELVGQDHVTRTLLNALRSGRLPHALLFSGARGVGKTSSARIFAKSLRCPNAKDFVPCNKCTTCEEVAHGSHIDVIEIDGASNNGVDAIRELRDTVAYMPSSGKYKVYIIDEVHMLSTSAFNALLKTLEEPPSHVVFIFATTEPQKIPITILSRCQRFDFRRIPTRQIAERLQLICKTENISAETDALWMIARQAEGALRDSQSLLDQAITFCDGTITQEKVSQILGLTDRTLLLETLQSLIARDPQVALRVVEKLYVGGFDPSVFVQDLLEQIRHLVILKTNPQQAATIVDLAESEMEELKKLGTDLGAEDAHLLFDMALKGANDLIRSQNPRIVLEMLLLRMSQAPRIVDLTAALSGGSPAPRATAGTTAPARSTRSAEATPSTNPTKFSTTPQVPIQQPPAAEPQAAPVVDNTPKILFDPNKDAQTNWLNLIEKMKTALPLLGAKLEYVSLVDLTPQHLYLAAKDALVLSQINDKATQTKLATFIKSFWGKDLEVKVEVAKSDSTPLSPKEMAIQAAAETQERVLQGVQNNPLVKKAQEVFKTKITSIKERS